MTTSKEDNGAGTYDAWIGSEISVHDVVTERLANSWSASTQFEGLEGSGDLLGLHWATGVSSPSNKELAEDGHTKKGGFLPPIDLPRRMWASGEVNLHGVLAVGDKVVRTSRVEKIAFKQGRSGELCFVTVGHVWSNTRGPLIEETQNIVYRSAVGKSWPDSADDRPGAPYGKHQLKINCGPTDLFRFSALTFNSHRIHYDFLYATEVESYPGLVVHGPLQATLLLNFARQVRGERPAKFAFRGVSPLILGSPFVLNADDDTKGLQLWITNQKGITTMAATAEWRQ